MQDFQDRVDRMKVDFKRAFRKGSDYPRKGGETSDTFGIDVSYFDPIGLALFRPNRDEIADATKWHGNKICVYGDEALRDRILAFLQEAK